MGDRAVLEICIASVFLAFTILAAHTGMSLRSHRRKVYQMFLDAGGYPESERLSAYKSALGDKDGKS